MPRPLQLPSALVVLGLLAAVCLLGPRSSADHLGAEAQGAEDAVLVAEVPEHEAEQVAEQPPEEQADEAAEEQVEEATSEQAEKIEPIAVDQAGSAAGTAQKNGDGDKPSVIANPRFDQLRDRLREVRDYYARRPLNTRDHSAWEVLHAVIGNGLDTQVRLDGPDGELRSAIGWLCFNQTFRGGQMLTLENGKPIGVIGVGLQGHQGQMLAYLAQTHLHRGYPMWVAGQSFTLEDLIENEKLTCQGGTELTFKLIGLAQYLPSDATWKTNDGQTWSIQRLIREEIVQPIQGAACGGTHRLMGLSYAVYKRQKEGKPLDGEFKRAHTYTRDYHRYTFRLQNPDGSFSTQWLEYREAQPDLARRLQCSGHILEWLAFSLPEEELRQPDMLRAVEYLSGMIWQNRERDWQIGPLGHALHSLAIYERRVFKTAERKLARRPGQKAEVPPARSPGEQAAELTKAEPPKAQPSSMGPPIRSILRRKVAPPQKSRADSAPMSDASVPHISSESGPRLIPAQPWLK